MKNLDRSQIEDMLQVMCKYYEIHEKKNISIEDYFSKEQYEKYKLLLKDNYSNEKNYITDFIISKLNKW